MSSNAEARQDHPDVGSDDDRQWPRKGVMVDGRMRWLQEGVIGGPVSGKFAYVFLQDRQVFRLSPSPPKEPQKRHGRGLAEEEQSSEIMGDSRHTEYNEAPLASTATSLQRPQGKLLAKSSNISITREDLDERFYANLRRTGRWPKGDSVALDMHGNFDIDYDNDGPELRPESQLTNAGDLTMENHEELAKKARKETKRQMKAFSMAQGEFVDELKDIERSSSVSSVSDISVTNYEASPQNQRCDPDCPLRLEGKSGIVASATDNENALDEHDPRLETYTYARISPSQTRILVLKGANDKSPLVGKLLPMTFGPREDFGRENNESIYRGQYEALSYTWGSSERPYSIRCETKRLFITKNLHSALIHLRPSDGYRYLWVDALCIDQENIPERNSQVRRMHDVYRSAHRVVVWLGKADEESGMAVDFLKMFDRRRDRQRVLLRQHNVTCYDRLESIYRALVALYRRSYFRRSWIRQEVAVAKKIEVRCGDDEMSWYALKRCAARLPSVRNFIQKQDSKTVGEEFARSQAPLEFLQRGWVYGQAVINPFGHIRSVWYYHAGGLVDLLMVGREFDAMDPRDKVYSVLNMAGTPTETADDSATNTVPCIEIDYEKTVSQVYQEVTKYIINRDRNLDILCILNTHRDQNSEDLPSWVPDWRVPTSHAKLKDCWDYFGCKYAAAGFTKAVAQNVSEYVKLTVVGYSVDRIRDTLNSTVQNSHDLMSIRDQESLDQYTYPFDASRDLRRLCITESARLCLVPSSAQDGDLLVILRGGKLPFVLRPCESEEVAEDSLREEDSPDEENALQVRIVGPCCIPDLMYGKAIKSLQESSMEEEKAWNLVIF
ncbi:uncharacterized protein KY384_000100 [Bacidia gigantensis]|uniref:uncharacterized protein n=1 Tax=Bacidia gigantensis TaxID=2732470 RepID=UPI001D043001|nr:uncharacterized protein KY384_000100 [Bacidia gigantensis]KAG8526107.1 hypothetical protein KY384_000100 [Bacidia gigantensis]